MAVTLANVDLLQKQLADCHSVLNVYKWLTDSFVLDFFTENHWSRLPSTWAETADSLSPEELGQCILNMEAEQRSCRLVLPLSMLALQAFTSASVLKRSSLSSLEQVHSYLHTENCNTSNYTGKNNWLNLEDNADSLGSLKVPHPVFRKHIKPKKSHELCRLGQTCSIVAKATCSPTVIDIGGGIGHLSRLLTFGYGLNLVCLECNEDLAKQATRLDIQFAEMCAKIGIAVDENSLPVHVTAMLSPDAVNLTDLLNAHSVKLEGSYGLAGLHTCGDLGPTMIRHFARDPDIRFILAIGCCYMKMDLTRPLVVKGYPMSDFVRSLQPSFVSYEALEVACHAVESYCDRLKDSAVEKLKVSTLFYDLMCSPLYRWILCLAVSEQIHCYRATLETLLVRLDPPIRRAGLRSVKNAHLMTFEQYAQKALERLDINVDSGSFAEPYTEEIRSCLAQWKRVVAFYSFRLMLAPLIETVIQLDRLLYLSEQGWRGCLLPLFDCRLSPRNYALLCVKPPPPAPPGQSNPFPPGPEASEAS